MQTNRKLRKPVDTSHTLKLQFDAHREGDMRTLISIKLLLPAIAGLLVVSSTGAFAQGNSCAEGCVQYCQKRGATGSMMSLCQSKCTSNCNMDKAGTAKSKNKK